MAKKTIISDFSALKGKVAFSEPSDVHDSASAKQKAQKAKSSAGQTQYKSKENHLQVGQSVVMMDSDHRGKIASLGRMVRIELEDGLVIEAAYGEFAVTDDTELEALKSSRIKHRFRLNFWPFS